MAVNVDGLVEIEAAFRPPAESMNQMVGVRYTETRQNPPLLIRLPIPVGVLQMKDFGGVGHVHPPVARQDARGRDEPFGKNRGLVGFAVPIRIFQYKDLVVGRFSRFHVRIGRAAHHPKTAVLIPVHLDGLRHQGVGGKERDLESVRHFERFQFLPDIRLRGVLPVVLANCGGTQQ